MATRVIGSAFAAVTSAAVAVPNSAILSRTRFRRAMAASMCATGEYAVGAFARPAMSAISPSESLSMSLPK